MMSTMVTTARLPATTKHDIASDEYNNAASGDHAYHDDGDDGDDGNGGDAGDDYV